MNAKSQRALVNEHDAVFGRSFDRILPDKGHEVTAALSGEEALATMNESEFNVVFTDIKRSGSKDLAKVAGMFIAAPFIALAYVLALPLIGLYQIARLAYKVFKKNHPGAAVFVKNVVLFFASPLIALAYVIALPFVGLFMFTKLAVEASR